MANINRDNNFETLNQKIKKYYLKMVSLKKKSSYNPPKSFQA